MSKTIIVALVLFGTSLQFSFAQQHPGNDKDEKTCIGDVTRFCRKLMDQSDLKILACLKENRTRLRPSCIKALADHGQ
jgi:hypothetical protein